MQRNSWATVSNEKKGDAGTKETCLRGISCVPLDFLQCSKVAQQVKEADGTSIYLLQATIVTAR
jgi:hypothetical protein